MCVAAGGGGQKFIALPVGRRRLRYNHTRSCIICNKDVNIHVKDVVYVYAKDEFNHLAAVAGRKGGRSRSRGRGPPPQDGGARYLRSGR